MLESSQFPRSWDEVRTPIERVDRRTGPVRHLTPGGGEEAQQSRHCLWARRLSRKQRPRHSLVGWSVRRSVGRSVGRWGVLIPPLRREDAPHTQRSSHGDELFGRHVLPGPPREDGFLERSVTGSIPAGAASCRVPGGELSPSAERGANEFLVEAVTDLHERFPIEELLIGGGSPLARSRAAATPRRHARRPQGSPPQNARCARAWSLDSEQ
jgi:hypothetical protein